MPWQEARRLLSYVGVALLVCAAAFAALNASTQPATATATATALSLPDVSRAAKLQAEVVELRREVDSLRKKKAVRDNAARAVAPLSTPAAAAARPVTAREKPAGGKVGIFILAINSTDYAGKPGSWQLTRAKNVACTLDKVGSKTKRYAFVYGYTAEAMKGLRGLGYELIYADGMAAGGRRMKPYFQPIFYASDRIGRRISPQRVQRREDGWATYNKLLLWNLTEFSKILYADTDVTFMSNPDEWLTQHSDTYFMADAEQYTRGWKGLNSHLLLITPDAFICRQLLLKARQRSYIVVTNGDQDVIEAIFDANYSTPGVRWNNQGLGKAPLPKHYHGNGFFCKDMTKIHTGAWAIDPSKVKTG